MTLQMFEGTLKSVVENTSHFRSYKNEMPRLIYAETEMVTDAFDNQQLYGRWKVDVHYFTIAPFDTKVDELVEMFNKKHIPFTLKTEYGVIPVDDTDLGFDGVIHYIFECVV